MIKQRPANYWPLILIFLFGLVTTPACRETTTPAAATEPLSTAVTPEPTATEPEPTATPAATETREGSAPRIPYGSASAGISLFHPPSWTVELAADAGMVLVAPETAAELRDISNSLIVAGPTSIVGQSIVAGEESLTVERADAAFQFLLPNFALPFVPDMVLGDEIDIVEQGQTSRATIPYTGTTVQEIPVTGTLSLIVDGRQVGSVLTLTTGGEAVEAVLAEMLGSISLTAPLPQ